MTSSDTKFKRKKIKNKNDTYILRLVRHDNNQTQYRVDFKALSDRRLRLHNIHYNEIKVKMSYWSISSCSSAVVNMRATYFHAKMTIYNKVHAEKKS